MRTSPPGLAPMFRSAVQLRVLGELFCGVRDAHTITELAETANTSTATAGREVELLRASSMVVVSPGPGRSKLVSANWEMPYHGEPGHFPRDIDLVVVTDASQFDLDISWRSIGRQLGMELNPIYPTSTFDPTADSLISGSPTVKLELDHGRSWRRHWTPGSTNSSAKASSRPVPRTPRREIC